MKQLENLTEDAKQSFDIILDDNSIAELNLEYIDSQQGWFYSITREDFTATNRLLVNSPNILRRFRNYIPFGILVSVTDGQDPAFLEDFSSGRVEIYILNEEDVQTVEDAINEG